MDLAGGKPTLDTIVDSEIEAFYTKGCAHVGLLRA